jgi:hypothetical protein
VSFHASINTYDGGTVADSATEFFNTQLGVRLRAWGIDLIGVENGVWLPTSKFGEATVHLGSNSMEYRTYIYRLVWMAEDKDEAPCDLGIAQTTIADWKAQIKQSSVGGSRDLQDRELARARPAGTRFLLAD